MRQLREPAQGEPTVPGEQDRGPVGGGHGRTDRGAHPEPDGPEVRRHHEVRWPGHLDRRQTHQHEPARVGDDDPILGKTGVQYVADLVQVEIRWGDSQARVRGLGPCHRVAQFRARERSRTQLRLHVELTHRISGRGGIGHDAHPRGVPPPDRVGVEVDGPAFRFGAPHRTGQVLRHAGRVGDLLPTGTGRQTGRPSSDTGTGTGTGTGTTSPTTTQLFPKRSAGRPPRVYASGPPADISARGPGTSPWCPSRRPGSRSSLPGRRARRRAWVSRRSTRKQVLSLGTR